MQIRKHTIHRLSSFKRIRYKQRNDFIFQTIHDVTRSLFTSTYKGKNPLFYICKQNNQDAIEYLISKGAKVNKMANPLISAIKNENSTIAKILISNGIDVNTKDDEEILFLYKFIIHLFT